MALATVLAIVASCFLHFSECALRLPLGAFTGHETAAEEQSSLSAQSGLPSSTINGMPGTGYYVTLGIGTPPQYLNFVVDTGSSNLAVAAYPAVLLDNYFKRAKSSTYHATGRAVDIVYTVGQWDGELAYDIIRLSESNNSESRTVRAKLGAILRSSDFFINQTHWHGILGLAYSPLARPDSSVTPLFDSMVRQGIVKKDVFSLQLCGPVASSDSNSSAIVSLGGSMVLGGTDAELFTGKMYHTPLYKKWYYEVVLVDVALDGVSLHMDCKEYNFDKTIVDSGTSSLRLPEKVFNALVSMLDQQLRVSLATHVNSLFYSGVHQLCWALGAVPWDVFPTVDLHLLQSENSSFVLEVAPQQYLRKDVDTNPASADFPRECYKFGIASSSTGAVLGAVVMEAFYVTFDRANENLGFALSSCPVDQSKGRQSAIRAALGGKGSAVSYYDCAFRKPPPSSEDLTRIVAYVLAGVSVLCVIPLTLYALWSVTRRCRRPASADEEQLVESEDKS